MAENARTTIEEYLGYGSYKAEEVTDAPIDWGSVNAEYEAAQKEKWAKCPQLLKAFYKEHPDVTSLSKAQVAEFREKNNNIVVTNFDEKSTAAILNPVSTFNQAFHPYLDILATIQTKGFSSSTSCECYKSEPKIHLRILSMSIYETKSVHASYGTCTFGGSVLIGQGAKTKKGIPKLEQDFQAKSSSKTKASSSSKTRT